MRSFFYNLPKNIARCFWGYNLFWHLLAIILTYIIVISNFDWLYFTFPKASFLRSFVSPAVRLGGLLPIIVPFELYVIGTIGKDSRTVNTAYALGQAAIIGLVVAAFYKAFTGRVHPPRLNMQNAIDISREFRFGFLRGGMFWGWPSSHTTIAFAMAVTLLMLYPKNRFVKYLAILYAFYIGFGVSIRIHWFSEVVAGAIIGTVIGVTVGRSFAVSSANDTN
jgi:membrane-associated phospholipid phosphatase